MGNLQTNYADSTAMRTNHAAAHNATNQAINNLAIYNVLDYGAVGNGKIVTDGAITATQNTLTSSSASFTSADVGKVISVVGAGAAGIPLATTIVSVSGGVATLTAAASVTVTGARVVYGTDDTAAIQSAHTNIPSSSGGKMLFPAGLIFCLTTNISISKSNIEIEFGFGATLIAMNQMSTAFKNEYMGMLWIYNSTMGAVQTNVTVKGKGIIDCNYQDRTSSCAVWGSGRIPTVVGTSGVTIQDVACINRNVYTSFGVGALVQAHSVTDLNLGRIKNLTVKSSTINGSNDIGFVIRGSYFDTVKVDDNEIEFIAVSSMQYVSGSEGTDTDRTSKNFYIRRNNFHDNMTVSQSQTVFDFGMPSRFGIITLHIEGNTFDGSNEYLPNDNPHLQIYASQDVSIKGNTFKNTRQSLSLGFSNGGTPWYVDPNNEIIIEGNRFLTCSIICDYDSQVRTLWTNNYFYQIGLNMFNAYSMHSFTTFENNTVHNTNTIVNNNPAFILVQPSYTTSTWPDQFKSCMTIGGQMQYYIRNNRFIDDRALQTPASTGTAGVTTVSGGALALRTYYYRFAYGNESGVTMAGPSQSISVPANSLIKISPQGAPTNARPANSGTPPIEISGIKQIYIYVGTTAGSETLQSTLAYPDFTIQGTGWTEPTSGLVTGAALPSSNTTQSLTKYGIYEETDEGGYLGPNVICDNDFYGISKANAIVADDIAATRMVRSNNTIIPSTSSGQSISLDGQRVYSLGNITGATLLSLYNGDIQQATLTGNITVTLQAGYIDGATLILELTQDGTGSRTVTWPSNFKKAGGALALSTAANAVDVITMRWDTNNWVEVSRSLNVS
jgi:hypothetical protein